MKKFDYYNQLEKIRIDIEKLQDKAYKNYLDSNYKDNNLNIQYQYLNALIKNIFTIEHMILNIEWL